MQDTVKLKISDDSSIEMILPCKAQDLAMCDDLKILLHNEEMTLTLYDGDYAYGQIITFNALLKEALAGQLQIHSSIKDDIGYLWTEYLHLDGEGDEFVEEDNQWIGLRYLLWTMLVSPKTWIYTKNDEIFLEVTPSYEWHFRTPKPEDKYVSYEEFIKNYKPLALIQIDKKYAEEWVKCTDELLEIIDENYKKTDSCRNFCTKY